MALIITLSLLLLVWTSFDGLSESGGASVITRMRVRFHGLLSGQISVCFERGNRSEMMSCNFYVLLLLLKLSTKAGAATLTPPANSTTSMTP